MHAAVNLEGPHTVEFIHGTRESVLVYVLSGGDFLPRVFKYPFLLRGFEISEIFGVVIVSCTENKHFEIDEAEAVKLIALAYYHRGA